MPSNAIKSVVNIRSVIANAYVILHPDDNVLICCKALNRGDITYVETVEYVFTETIEVGHKIARINLSAGDKVIRYGAPIGSITETVEAGFHVHTHNMKSDYIPSHGRDAVHIKGEDS